MTVKAFGLSIVLHALLFIVLQSGFSFVARPQNKFKALEAKMMLKEKVRKPDLLPRKPQVATPKPEIAKKPEKVVSEAPVLATPTPTPTPKALKPEAKPNKSRYADQLALLSKNFAAEINTQVKAEEVIPEWEDDGSYFDQIYSLIKKSFVVPPHLNGPQGHNLQAVLRLFLSSDGNLSRLNLEQSSGDEHFDKAVMEGTRRVNNFGAVPLMLQSSLSSQGVVVEMCPFKCAERRGG